MKLYIFLANRFHTTFLAHLTPVSPNMCPASSILSNSTDELLLLYVSAAASTHTLEHMCSKIKKGTTTAWRNIVVQHLTDVYIHFGIFTCVRHRRSVNRAPHTNDTLFAFAMQASSLCIAYAVFIENTASYDAAHDDLLYDVVRSIYTLIYGREKQTNSPYWSKGLLNTINR